jgi:Isocitrate/isopropylmalate dehydrogenase
MAVERFTAAEASRWALLRSSGRPAHQRASLIQLLYVDAASFEILRAPHKFDVIVTDDMFGDILSDEEDFLAGRDTVLEFAQTFLGLGELRRQRARMAPVAVNRSGAPRRHPHGG